MAVKTDETNQYLTFTLGEEDFALEIGKIREVLDYTTITKVPRMPEFLRGVINLRGNVVPVIDLKQKLGMGAIEQSVDTCIVIVEIMIDDEMTQMGALADSVKEVTEIDPSDISPPPKLGIKVNNEFIRGMGRQEDKFLIILNIDKVLTTAELDMVQKTNA
ncbi:MAG: chemotaxis protein CheW [Desulfobacteraceae bacterium]|nr:chemotaxis protein CheW [Desulfobacteraceae bacterium]